MKEIRKINVYVECKAIDKAPHRMELGTEYHATNNFTPDDNYTDPGVLIVFGSMQDREDWWKQQ